MNSADPRILQFKLNRPQARALIVMANETWLPWARATGKTGGVIAPWILHKVKEMARSTGGLVGKSFADIETKILKPIFEAFGMMGHLKDLHYCYGKVPPESWDKPLIPVIDYSHVVSFPNGTTIELISLHNKGSANGLSLQWIVADEAKLLSEVQLREEVFPILRGNVKYFGRSPWYGAKLFVTDKLSSSIHWILDKKKLMDEELIGTIIFYQLKVNELILQLDDTKEESRAGIRRRIRKIDRLLAILRKKAVYYSEARAIENIENLSPDFFENMKRTLPDFVYRVSIDNEDPRRVENCYYASRTAKHLYSSRFDDDITKPLAVALDYQASFSPLVSCQLNELVVPGVKTLNFLKDFYVKQPLGIKHVIDDFCQHHKYRPCKEVYYFYDHTAVGERNMHKKYWEEVVDYFEANDWNVTPVYMHGAPKQGIKYSRINSFFENEGVDGFPIRMNDVECATTVLAMDQTGTKEVPDQGTKKDKSKERDKEFPQEQATHLPDTFDQLVWGINELKLYPTGSGVGQLVGLRK